MSAIEVWCRMTLRTVSLSWFQAAFFAFQLWPCEWIWRNPQKTLFSCCSLWRAVLVPDLCGWTLRWPTETKWGWKEKVWTCASVLKTYVAKSTFCKKNHIIIFSLLDSLRRKLRLVIHMKIAQWPNQMNRWRRKMRMTPKTASLRKMKSSLTSVRFFKIWTLTFRIISYYHVKTR